MDIKEKDLYLAELLEREVITQDEFRDLVFKPEINAFDSNYLSSRFIDKINFGWSAWQAKAQAVPEGFVLIKASDRDQEMLELIDQRDYMESQAEELKDKLQTLYGVNFGEHSSCNFPFQNAIDYDDSDLVSVKKNHLSEVIEKIERMFEEDPLLALGELLPIQQGIKAMIEAQEPAND